jgi:hypothetical protein
MVVAGDFCLLTSILTTKATYTHHHLTACATLVIYEAIIAFLPPNIALQTSYFLPYYQHIYATAKDKKIYRLCAVAHYLNCLTLTELPFTYNI